MNNYSESRVSRLLSPAALQSRFQLNRLRVAVGGVGIVAAVLAGGALAATPMTISNAPLEGQQVAEPNVMILQDDSGSMDWEYSMDGTTNSLWNSVQENNNYVLSSSLGSAASHTAGNFYNLSTSTCSTTDPLPIINCSTAGYRNIWAARTSGFNKLYYNPATVYTPWAGYKTGTTLYPPQNATNTSNYTAVISGDPNATSPTTINLTREYTSGSTNNLYPAFYYTVPATPTAVSITAVNTGSKTITVSSATGLKAGDKIYGNGIDAPGVTYTGSSATGLGGSMAKSSNSLTLTSVTGTITVGMSASFSCTTGQTKTPSGATVTAVSGLTVTLSTSSSGGGGSAPSGCTVTFTSAAVAGSAHWVLSAAAAAGDTHLHLVNANSVEIGQAVIGTGIPTGTYVQGVSPVADVVILSQAVTASIASGSTLVFSNGAMIKSISGTTLTMDSGNLAVVSAFLGPRATLIESGSTYTKYPARTDCAGTSCTYDEEMTNFSNWYAYYRKRQLMAKASLGDVLSKRQSIRVGIAFINGKTTGKEVAELERDISGTNKSTLLTTLYTQIPGSSTPLRTGLDNLGKYFSCSSLAVFGSSTTPSSTPGGAHCPMQTGLAACQSNYALLTTDGYWNDSYSSSTIGDRDGRTTGTGSEYAGLAFQGAAASSTLADVAMYYYDHDLFTSIADQVPTTTLDKTRVDQSNSTLKTKARMHQHMKTFTVGFGVGGSLPLYQINENMAFSPPNKTTAITNPWPVPASNDVTAVDDLAHAAYNGRGSYLNAADTVALKAGLNQMFDTFMEGVGSASAASFDSQVVEADAYQYRTSYNMGDYTGDVMAYQIDATTGDLIDSDPSTTSIIDPVWKFSEKLYQTAPADRKIFTWGDSNAGINFTWANVSASTALQSGGINTQQEVDYLRGDTTNEAPAALNFRKRAKLTNGNPNLVGDIVHSGAYYLGDPHANHPGDTSYSDFVSHYGVTKDIRTGTVSGTPRAQTLFVGSNDGMLHAINAESDASYAAVKGTERWAYIPRRLLKSDPDTSKSSSLSDLLGSEYTHHFYVDAAPQIEDVKYGTASGTNDWQNWKTVLVGGMGMGGKALYAIDVTQPDTVDASKVLWEVSNETTGYTGNLGFTYGEPLIGRINGKWYAIIGNGYNSENGKAGLFFNEIEPASGKPKNTYFIEASAVQQTGGYANGLGAPRGVDYDGDQNIDYIYAGDMNGVLYRFNIPKNTDPTPSNVKAYAVYQAKHGTVNQPIQTAPLVVPNLVVSGELIVVFSTGSWITTSDATSTDVQSIYGIRDSLTDTTGLVSSTSSITPRNSGVTNLVQQSYANYTDTTLGISGYTLSNNGVTLTGTNLGWYNDLTVQNGERVVARMRLVGTDPTSYYVVLDTMLPKNTSASASCTETTSGHFLIFNPMTGGLPGAVFYGADGTLMTQTYNGNQYIAGFDRDTGLTSSQAIGDSQRRYQVGSKDYTGLETNLAKNTGWVSWRELSK